MTLRPYQIRAKNDIEKFLLDKKKTSSIAVLPTGAGKTICIKEAIELIGGPVIILQPSVELLNQNFEEYVSHGFDATIYSASAGIKELSKTTFATIGSIKNKVSYFKSIGVKHIIIDECHLGTRNEGQIGSFCKLLGVEKILGFTATPIYLGNGMNGPELRMMNRARGSLFKDICHVTNPKELVDLNFWSKIDYRNIDVSTGMLELNKSKSDYTLESLEEYHTQNNIDEKIIHYCERMTKADHILVFVESVAHALELEKLIPSAKAIHGGTPKGERPKIIKDYKSGKIRVLINCQILIYGFNFPKLQVIITARPTASMSIYYQQLGRLVRKHPEKPITLILDMSGNCIKFGRIEDLVFENNERYGWCLRSGNKILTVHQYSFHEQQNRVEQATKDFAKILMIFGKYKDVDIATIYKKDPNYIKWVAGDKFEPSSANGMLLKNYCKQMIKKI
jgi:DNA repair protein RadD